MPTASAVAPDTSIYNRLQPQGGIGSMSLGDLINTAAGARNLQTQSAVSGALGNNIDPSTGMVDYSKVAPAAAASGAYLTPDLLHSITNAQGAQSELQTGYLKQAASALGSIITKPNATVGDFQWIAPWLERTGVPHSMIMDIMSGPSSGPAFQSKLATINNWVNQNAGITNTAPTVGATGGVTNTPAATLLYPPQGGASPNVGGTKSGPPTAPGSYTSALPPATAGTQTAAAGEAVDMLKQGPQIAQTRAMLSTLGDLSDEAATGPTAGFEQRLGELAARLGLPSTLTSKSLSSTEEYSKIAETLAGNMAASNHATDAFLHNAYGSNPNLNLSQLGREGITHWLQGNIDAQSTLQGQWSQWIAQHPGQEGNYFQWLYGKQMPDGSKGFDVTNFDPRVFQYERMSVPEQQEFLKSIKGKGALGTFMVHHQAYTNNGWVGGANTNQQQ